MPLSVDQTVFFKTWLKRPMRTGAVVPSSNALGAHLQIMKGDYEVLSVCVHHGPQQRHALQDPPLACLQSWQTRPIGLC